MKKLINSPDSAVDEMLEGFVSANHDSIKRLDNTNVTARKDAPVEGKVGMVTGGGSGHEPMHAGYVGEGMLDAAANGAIFTSPPATDIRDMIETCDSGVGVFLVIKNYEGDIMNFDTAADLAADVETRKIIVDDDVAVSDADDRTGRRGVAGTVFVHKIVGAKAAQGGSLSEVEQIARKTVDNMASMGVALKSCITPAKGEPTVDLNEDEMELGIGIHGEPGVNRTTIEPADAITESLVEPIMEDLALKGGENVVAMVNGLGGTANGELYIVYRKLHQMLSSVGVTVVDAWIDEYCTSLEMAGCSITLLKVDDELKDLLNYPVQTPALTIN